MGVIILSEKYTHIERPQDQNIAWLLGNVGVWQKLTLRVEFKVAIDFDTTNALFMEEPNVFTLTNGSTWRDNGFDVGDTFTVQWTTQNIGGGATTSTVNGTIIQIDGNTMYSNNSTLGTGAQESNIYPVQLADKKIHSVFITKTNDSPPESIYFNPFHLPNNQISSVNPSSFIDGTITEFLAENVDLLTFGQTQSFTFLGNQSGMSIANCDLTYVTKVGRKYIYDIEMVFMISSFFDDITNFQTDTAPSVVFDVASLAANYNIIGYPTANNPNVTIKNDPQITKQLGNTGWFNENYNGLPNVFTISSVSYLNASGTAVNQLDYQNPITLRAVIDDIPNVTGQTKCTFGFAWIPIEDAAFKDLTTPFYQNVKMNTGGGAATFSDVFTVSTAIDPTLRSGYSNDGASMDVRNIRFQNTAANQITFEAEFVPNAAFATFMDARDISDRNYILWINVGDQTEVTNKSDRVCLLLDFNQLDTFIEPVGAFAGMSIDFLDHTQDENSTPNACGVDMRIEDGILAKVLFQVDTAVSPTIPIPTGITYGIMIERASDGLQYFLESESIDLTQFPDPTQYNFSASRGFKLVANNDKNFIKVDYFPSLDSGTLKGVRGLYGFKVRWEDWIARTNVPIEVRNTFFDNSLKSNGLSNDWYRYLNTSGWSLFFVVLTDALLDGVSVRYENTKELVFKDYNENADITVVHTYKRESDLTVISGGTDPESGLPLGVILNNELVRLEIEYTRAVGTWASANDVYCINTIEVREGAGFKEYRQLSSIVGSEVDNPLLPLPGESFLNVVLVSPTVIRATCLIDPNKLDQSTQYKITGRIGCNP